MNKIAKIDKINFSLSIFCGEQIPIEWNQKDPLKYLIFDFNEIEYLLEQNNPDLVKFLFFSKNTINIILYQKEEIIKINNKLLKNKLSEYFYFLLIINNSNLINYEFSLDFIKEANNQLNKNNIWLFKYIINYKIITELISYYKQIDNYKESEKNELNKIILDNENELEKDFNQIRELFERNWNLDRINKTRIDELYIDIFEILLKSNKIRDYEFTCKILEDLNFENINLTKVMFDKLSDILDINNNKYLEKYFSDDFLLNEEAINFYYFLFKYILKSSIYIYHFPILFKIKRITRQYLLKDVSIFKNMKENKKTEYIIDFIMDSKYYRIKYNKLKNIDSDARPINSINERSKEITRPNSYNISLQSTNSFSNVSNFESCSINNDENDYLILKYENTIEEHDKKFESIEFMKETSIGMIITGGIEDKFCIYDKNHKFIKDISFTIPEDTFHIKQDSGKITHKRKYKKYSQNIEETQHSKNNKNNNMIEILDCSRFALMSYSLKFNKIDFCDINVQISKPEQLSLSCTGIIEIENIGNKNEYVVYGERGIFHFNDWPFNLGINSETKLYNYNKNKRSYRSGIRINKNYIALSSNKILPNGDNILAFYDIKEKKIIKEIEGSFANRTNALCLFKITEENSSKERDILLCACKKYMSEDKNGIIAVDSEIFGEKFSYEFFDLDDFEVNCFCQIGIKQNFEWTKSNYFFVGGLDTSKRLGLIKLYKIIYNKNKIKIKFIEDILIEKNEDFEGLNGTVNNIIQTANGKILVSCWDGKIFSFSEPNIDYYLEEDNKDYNT